MNKNQALASFWGQFGLTAYDETSVPHEDKTTGQAGATLPYITFEAETDSLGTVLTMSGSLWYRSPSWTEIDRKAAEIERTLKEYGYWICNITGGYLKINAGEPFAVHMTEPNDDTIRRIKINIEAEFLTAY